MEKHVYIAVKCPHCRESLMDEGYILNSKPAIRLNANYKDQSGNLYLCARFGCYDHNSEINVPSGEQIDSSCPHCNKSLNTTVECEACGAPMITFVIKSGGRASICSRHGCNKHYVSFQDLETAIRQFHEEFGE
jgi:phage FluMu protein Com